MIWIMFIPDPDHDFLPIPDPDHDFLPIPDPGCCGQKGTGSQIQIRNTVRECLKEISNSNKVNNFCKGLYIAQDLSIAFC
jgi:hypothetical protein